MLNSFLPAASRASISTLYFSKSSNTSRGTALASMISTMRSSLMVYSTSTSQSTTRYVSNFLFSALAFRSRMDRMSKDKTSLTNSINKPTSAYKVFAARLRAYELESGASALSATSTRTIFNGSSLAASLPTQSGAVEFGIESANGTYGLISSTGVPSTKSIPPTTTTPRSASTRSTVPTDSPTGTGRCGVLVANTPTRSPSNLGTATLPFAAPPVFVPARFVLA